MTACDWPLIYTQCEGDGSCAHLESMDEQTAEAVEASAVDWLWEATNRRFGNCTVTFLPCINGCHNNYGQMWPTRLAGTWVNVGCAICVDTCACSAPSQVILPTKGTVIEVRLDGVPLAAEDWRVLNHKYLIRVDGGAWPACQDLTANPPTWEVDFIPGNPVPQMGQIAAGLLACQLARRFCGQACELPANTSSVTRQGVTITLDPTTMTGIYLIDRWIELMNKAQSRVWNPDVPVVRIPVVLGS